VDQPSLSVMIALSLLAGAAITVATRGQQGTSSDAGKAIDCMGTGLLVIGFGMLHGAINAIIIFAAMFAGADVSILQFLQWFGIQHARRSADHLPAPAAANQTCALRSAQGPDIARRATAAERSGARSAIAGHEGAA